MTRHVVAIDNGSQSTKVLIVDERGAVRASARVGLRPYETSAPGRVVHPDDDVWDSIAAACRLALGRFDGDHDSIVGVGLCTIRFCRALLRDDGSLAEPLLSWMDERVGKPFDGARGVERLATSSGYVTHRLTGEFRDAAANFQGVWPIDQRTWRWSEDPAVYEATGMPRQMLPELVEPGGLLGTVTADAARATGLPEGLAVYATANDKAVEALGAGLAHDDELLLSLGTYISSMTIAPAPESGSAYWSNFGSRPGQYLAESEGIRRGMWTVSWFRSLLTDPDRGDGGQVDADPPVIASQDDLYALEAELSRAAAALPLGSDGVTVVLDWLATADEPSRRGAILGFSGSQGRAHIHRAILEGIAFTMADHAETMSAELGRSFTSLIVTGGGAHSDLMLQLAADAFGLPVRRSRVDDAAGIGAAVCAAVGAGLHPSWDDAVARMVGVLPATAPGDDAPAAARLRAVHRGVRERVRALSAWTAEQGDVISPTAIE